MVYCQPEGRCTKCKAHGWTYEDGSIHHNMVCPDCYQKLKAERLELWSILFPK